MSNDGHHIAKVTSFNQTIGRTIGGGHRGPTAVKLCESITDEQMRVLLGLDVDPMEDLILKQERSLWL